jgi:hypothetical protein
MVTATLSRRKFLWKAGATLSGLVAAPSLLLAQQNRQSAAQFALQYRDAHWQAWHLNQFLDLISDQDRWALKLSLGLEGNKTKGRLRGHAADIDDILEELLWHTSHVCCYWLRDEWSIAYHNDVVVWCAKKLRWVLGMPAVDASRSTFELEHNLLVHVFLWLWNRLSAEQQAQLLEGLTKEAANNPKARAEHAARQGEKAAMAVRELQNDWLLKHAPKLEKALDVLEIPTIYQLLAGVVQLLTATPGILPPSLPPIDDTSKTLGKLLRAALRVLTLGNASATNTLPFVLTLHCIKIEHQLRAGLAKAQIFSQG